MQIIATQLGGEIAARIEERLQTYLEVLHAVNTSHAHAIALAEIDILQEPERLDGYFWKQIRTYKNLSSLYIGTIRGHFSSIVCLPQNPSARERGWGWQFQGKLSKTNTAGK